MNLHKSTVWRGTHRDVPFKIVNWSIDSDYFRQEYPTGNWNYYIYLQESKCPKFDELWLEEVKRPGLGGREYWSYNYMSGLVGSIKLHGGITFYDKHGYRVGARIVEVGCDYQHYADSGMHYNENILYHDACESIDWCYNSGILMPKSSPQKGQD